MVSGKEAWRIIPRPILETVLNSHAKNHRVPQPLIIHGPRGVGKTTLILERLFEGWNSGPHIAGYVDFAESIEGHHPKHGNSYPWASWSVCPPPKLATLKTQLEDCLESMALRAINFGKISSHEIFKTLNKWHSPTTALKQILNRKDTVVNKRNIFSKSRLWDSAIVKFSTVVKEQELDEALVKSMTVGEQLNFREVMAALKVAKEVIRVQEKWRENAIRDLNRKGGFSRSLANSATDWPCLLLELLSMSAEVGSFQPKLVLNNIEVLKSAVATDTTICGSMYHDSLIGRIIGLGASESCLPVFLVTSDGYYSYRAFIDFGFPDIFISRETFGWTPAEAKVHLVGSYFTQAEWDVIVEVLGSSPRHLFEFYMLKLSNYYQKVMNYESSSLEDIMDLYLAYLQVTVVNPAIGKALVILENFAIDARGGKIPKDKLRFGAPWRLASNTNDPHSWAKLQLMDFMQSFVTADFGVNYLADCSLEIFDDPAAVALIEVGLLYVQREPSFIRPVSRGFQRCLVRWFVQEQMHMDAKNNLQYRWQRVFRGRSYRHLMLENGYNKY